MVFVPAGFFLTSSVEKRKYEHHQNEPEDLVYQEYLKQIMDPVLERISEGAKGLDFGCGSDPALSQMFEADGYQTDVYDAYFAPNEEVFGRSYDFITACEVVEHFYKPQMELDRLFSMLRPGGILAIKTQMLPFEEEFSTWYYKRDITHVCFFSERSMRFLADKWTAELIVVKSDVVLFIKTPNN
jgi:SAM-dependent methyltransferase